MRVFIDANYYLKFIDKPLEKSESFEELENLLKDEESKRVDLIFPKITREEFVRNALSAKVDFINLPEKPPLEVSFTVVDKETKEKINNLHKEYRRELEKLRKHYRESIEEYVTKLLIKFQKLAIDTPETEDLIIKAHHRKIKGNPPGKKNHIGDELVWEIILKLCVDDDLTIISGDSDWRDKRYLDEIRLHPFLEKEWKLHSKREILLQQTLGDFINKLTGKETISKKDIEKEKEESRRPSILDEYTVPVSLISVSGTHPPISDGSVLGSQQLGSAQLGGSIIADYSPRCPECGNPLDLPNIYLLCTDCRNRRGLP